MALIGLDTNVLVRLLVRDDSSQAGRADRLLSEAALRGDRIQITPVVLLETEWVLRSRYTVGRVPFCEFLDALLNKAGVDVEREAVVEEALRSFRAGPSDFADCLMAAEYAAGGCSRVVTFDKAAAKLTGVELITGGGHV